MLHSKGYVIHYDADGGGFGAFLISYLGTLLISEALGFELICVNPMLRAVIKVEGEINVAEVLKHSRSVRLTDIILKQNKTVLSYCNMLDYLFENRYNCILYGRHHLPPIDFESFLKCVGGESFYKYASKKLIGITLTDYYTDYHNMHRSQPLAIHIRTFFDSREGKLEFQGGKSLFYGFLLEKLLAGEEEFASCFLASDDISEWLIARSLLIRNGIDVTNSHTPPIHSSLSSFYGLRLMYADRNVLDDIELIKSQANFASMTELTTRLSTPLDDWLGIGTSDYIICTHTSFAISAALFFGKYFLTFPCRPSMQSLVLPLTIL